MLNAGEAQKSRRAAVNRFRLKLRAIFSEFFRRRDQNVKSLRLALVIHPTRTLLYSHRDSG